LGPNQVKGDYSGRPDDRWIFSTTNPYLQWNAIAALAAAADALKGWDDALAKDALDTAIKTWNDENAHPTPNPARDSSGASVPGGTYGSGVLAASQGAVSGAKASANGHARSGSQAGRIATGAEAPPPDAFGRGDFEVGQVWTAALELAIATHGAD